MNERDTVAFRARLAGKREALEAAVQMAEEQDRRTHLPAANRLSNVIRKLRYMRDHADQ